MFLGKVRRILAMTGISGAMVAVVAVVARGKLLFFGLPGSVNEGNRFFKLIHCTVPYSNFLIFS